jgi:hypothetical protein
MQLPKRFALAAKTFAYGNRRGEGSAFARHQIATRQIFLICVYFFWLNRRTWVTKPWICPGLKPSLNDRMLFFPSLKHGQSY